MTSAADDNSEDSEYSVTESAKQILRSASMLASTLNQIYITSEHILYCLLNNDNTADIVLRVLRKLKIDVFKLRRLVYDSIKSADITSSKIMSRIRNINDTNEVYYSPKVKEIVSLASVEADMMGTLKIGTEHLLLGIMQSDSGIATSIFRQTGIDVDILREEILQLIETGPKGKSRMKRQPKKNTPDKPSFRKTRKRKPVSKDDESALERFTTDITEMAEQQKLLPVIGRVDEIDRVIQTLMRKSKNNPVIIGEPGVGKTAIVEGLAQKIINKEVPVELANKKLLALDIPLMVAGTKYRGQFEERLTQVIAEIISRDDIIVFIDELHMMVGAGDADGAMDASNMLKPALSRGELTLIGATTVAEYTKYIEKDGALERRFQQVQILEPSLEDTIQILYGIKAIYEDYHTVSISNECLEKMVYLCDRYITDRNFPDKAIDVLDESCAFMKLNIYRRYNYDNEDLEAAVNNKIKNIHEGNFEEAIQWREEENKERKKSAKKAELYERSRTRTYKMRVDDVERVISKITGIPINSVKHGDKGKIKKLQTFLQKHIIGQEHAIHTIVTSIKRSHTGLSDQSKPIGGFLFLGPTGVGKTYITKCLAEYLFDSVDNIIRVDMSELMESHSVSKLVGSPPGYVGHDSGGKLTEQVRRKPYSVILFDEIEKAHPDVLNILLQVLDEGNLTDSHGRHVNFKNTIIILTSNIGARQIQKNTVVGFSRNDTESSDRVLDEARKLLPPEFINRLDEIVMFNELEKNDLLQICNILIEDVVDRLAENGIELTVTPKVKRCIVEMNTEEKYGARPLKRLISKHIENEVSDFLLDNKTKQLHATCKKGKIIIQSKI